MSMWKKSGTVALMGLLVLGGFFAAPAWSAAATPVQVTDENLAQLLEKLLKERPDLVIDVLRNNSEAVLDIAQQGSN
ncbi:MAG: disulfide bond formation protein DsbA, partial [Desulfovibrio sp.]|nr:disulfide bond formation protein DsbA [Desulfovibrio sp.]